MCGGPWSATSRSSAVQNRASSSAGTSGSIRTSASFSTSAYEDTSASHPSGPPSSGVQSGCVAVQRQSRGRISVTSTTATLVNVDRLDPAVVDLPAGEGVGAEREDQVGPALPEPDVLDVRARRARWGGEVRVEDGELVAVVLQEPRLRRHVELEPIRRGGGVAAADVALGDAVAHDDEAAGLVRRLLLGVAP